MAYKNMKLMTTIIIKKTTLKRLKKVKVHERQSADEIINDMIDMWKEAYDGNKNKFINFGGTN